MRQKTFEELEKMDPKEMTFQEKGLLAFQRAVDKVVLENKRLGIPVRVIIDGEPKYVKVEEVFARRFVENLYSMHLTL